MNGAIVIRLSSTAKTPANSSGASASIVARAASTAIVAGLVRQLLEHQRDQ